MTDVHTGVRAAVRRIPGPCAHWDDDDADFIRQVLDRVGDKWSVLIVGTLEGGPLRYTELVHGIPGISQRMTTTSRSLAIVRSLMSGPDHRVHAWEIRAASHRMENSTRAAPFT